MIDIIQGIVSPGATQPGYDIIQSPSGPAGPAGAAGQTGLLFSWAGLITTGEPALPGVMPSAGSFSAANSSGSSEVPATASSVFQVTMRPPGGGFSSFATVTFTAGGAVVAFAGSGAYVAGAYFKCLPPATPDVSLFGATILLGGP